MALIWKFVKPLRMGSSVHAFCGQKGAKIPERLASFIEQHNGGRPSECTFDTNVASGYVFNSLYSYNPQDATFIGSTYDVLFAGTDLYPIGIEAAGNVICYSMATRNLVLWNHETDAVEQINVRSNPSLFAGMV